METLESVLNFARKSKKHPFIYLSDRKIYATNGSLVVGCFGSSLDGAWIVPTNNIPSVNFLKELIWKGMHAEFLQYSMFNIAKLEFPEQREVGVFGKTFNQMIRDFGQGWKTIEFEPEKVILSGSGVLTLVVPCSPFLGGKFGFRDFMAFAAPKLSGYIQHSSCGRVITTVADGGFRTLISVN